MTIELIPALPLVPFFSNIAVDAVDYLPTPTLYPSYLLCFIYKYFY